MRSEEESFGQFMREVTRLDIPRQAFDPFVGQYDVNAVELGKTTPEEVQQVRSILLGKMEEEERIRQSVEREWLDVEKKIYNWLLMCYLHLHQTRIEDLKEQDYARLAELWIGKSAALMKYHTLSLLRCNKRPKWSPEQDRLLIQILGVEKKHKTVGEWSHVSREFFLRGDQNTYKSGKNCRERWLNHLDPSINKEWSRQQDLKMLHIVREEGKRWAHIATKLNNTKSQHMVKNRFNSLLRKAGKSKKLNLNEEDMVGYVIQLLESNSEIQETRWGIAGQRPVKKAKSSQENKSSREDERWKMIIPEFGDPPRFQDVGHKGGDQVIPKIEEGHDTELRLITSSSTVFKGRQQDQVWRIIEPPPNLMEKNSSDGKNSSTLSKSRSFRLSDSLQMATISLKPPTPQAGIFEPSPLPKTPDQSGSVSSSFLSAMRRVDPRQYNFQPPK